MEGCLKLPYLSSLRVSAAGSILPSLIDRRLPHEVAEPDAVRPIEVGSPLVEVIGDMAEIVAGSGFGISD